MSNRSEVIVTSDTSGLHWTACIWDSYTGTSLMTYKGGGTAGLRCLSLVGNDYLLCAQKLKPLIQVWPLNCEEGSSGAEKMILPGCASALCVSPNCDYCVIGIAEKIYIWNLLSGDFEIITTRHVRAVSCIKFTDDGSHFISCGEDGFVLVWPLASLVAGELDEFLQQNVVGQQEPKYTFANHSLPVTDLYVGHGGIQALLASVSGDHTCKIYDLSDGTLLLSVVFNSSLTALTMNVNELEVFVGSVSGGIYLFNMQHMPRTLDYHAESKDLSHEFKGHSKAITSLSTSVDGLRLLSGSADGKVIIWDIKSKQCLKIIQHKGPVTNAYFTMCPKHVFARKFIPSCMVTNFKKYQETNVIRIIRKDDFEEKYTKFNKQMVIASRTSASEAELQRELVKLKEANAKLYSLSLNKILNTVPRK